MWGVLLKACQYDPERVLDFLMVVMAESDKEHKRKFKETYESFFK